MLITDTGNLVVNLQENDDYILVTYKIYGNCVEVIELTRVKKSEEEEK